MSVENNSKETEDYIDLEKHFKDGKNPPKGNKYKIKVDRKKYKVEQSSLTGGEILKLANKTPVQRFQLNQKLRGGVVEKVEYSQKVDFSEPGIERFMTIPLDQTEG